MEMNKRQVEFWGVTLLICLVVSVAIMIVDFQIKQAILEESTRLRLSIEEWEVRKSGLRADKVRATDDSANHTTIPGYVLVEPTAGMEAGNVRDGSQKEAPKSQGRRRNVSNGEATNRKVPPGDK